MKKIAATVILILLFSGCGSEYAEDEAQQFNTISDFSEWSTYFRNEDGQPVMPERFFRISVRDARTIDSTHAEVDSQWSASGIAIPGETFALENSEGTWRVI